MGQETERTETILTLDVDSPCSSNQSRWVWGSVRMLRRAENKRTPVQEEQHRPAGIAGISARRTITAGYTPYVDRCTYHNILTTIAATLQSRWNSQTILPFPARPQIHGRFGDPIRSRCECLSVRVQDSLKQSSVSSPAGGTMPTPFAMLHPGWKAVASTVGSSAASETSSELPWPPTMERTSSAVCHRSATPNGIPRNEATRRCAPELSRICVSSIVPTNRARPGIVSTGEHVTAVITIKHAPTNRLAQAMGRTCAHTSAECQGGRARISTPHWQSQCPHHPTTRFNAASWTADT